MRGIRACKEQYARQRGCRDIDQFGGSHRSTLSVCRLVRLCSLRRVIGSLCFELISLDAQTCFETVAKPQIRSRPEIVPTHLGSGSVAGSNRLDAEGNCAATEFKPHAINQKHIFPIINSNMEDRWMNKLAHAATKVSGWAARVLAAAAMLAAIGVFGDASIARSGAPSLFAAHQGVVNA
ncbi:MAG: hypothetical protein M9944_03665 [Rhizobiaceae bacterium]|nr:hypothetical protein [Rhizobiaceae bacterium]